MTASEYFRDIRDTVNTVAEGMALTLRYGFQKVATVQYPEVRLPVSPRYRGIHEFEAERCIACEACVRACPVDCITVVKSGLRKIDKATNTAVGGELTKYEIDYSKCMFCALCTEPCPTECIHMGQTYDMSTTDKSSVIVDFVTLDKQGLRTPKTEWMTRNAPHIPWVAAELKRVESRQLGPHEGDIVSP